MGCGVQGQISGVQGEKKVHPWCAPIGNLEHLKGINFKIFFNHGEEIAYLFDSLWSILEGPNLKIFFNHGEEIIYLLGRFGA